jgi:hypothetical protein
VSIAIRIGHGIDREDDVEAEFVGVTRRRFDAYAGGDADDRDLRDAKAFQMGFEVRVGECSPRPLGYQMISRLLVQLRDQIGRAGGKISRPARLFGPTRRACVDIDEHDRQAMAAERIGQRASALHHVADRMDGRKRNDAILQVDDDKSGLRINSGDSHGARLPCDFDCARHS